jgi:hypothetical protein
MVALRRTLIWGVGSWECTHKLVGINVESTPVIVLVDVIAALLIAAALVLPAGALLALACVGIVAFGPAAVGLDVREAIHIAKGAPAACFRDRRRRAARPRRRTRGRLFTRARPETTAISSNG